MEQNQLHLNQSCDREYMIYVAYLDDSVIWKEIYRQKQRENGYGLTTNLSLQIGYALVKI